MGIIKLFLVIIVLATQILVIVFPFIGKISDNRRRWRNRFTKLGYALLICCIISFISSLGLLNISQSEDEENQRKLRIALTERDSINQAKIDRANSNLFESFAKYGLKYDLAERRISRLIKDSSKVSYIIGDQPFLHLLNVEKVLKPNPKSVDFKMTLSSGKSTSYEIKLRFDLIEYDSLIGKYKYIQQNVKFIADGLDIGDGRTSTSIQHLNKISENTKFYFFHLKGSYQGSDGIRILMNKFYAIDMSVEKEYFGEPGPILTDELNKFTGAVDP